MRDELERIYREHRQGLFALALSVTRRADLAEDAVHDALVNLYRTRAKPRGGGDMVGYVFTAVRNAAIDITRRRKVRESGSGGESLFDRLPTDAADPRAAAAEAEQAARIMAAVDALPDNQREVIVLRLIAGLKFEQIAATLELPLGTVTTRYRRTVEQLREDFSSADE